MPVTLLSQGKSHSQLTRTLTSLGKQFMKHNNLTSEEVFVKSECVEFNDKIYTKAFIFLGEYIDDPYKSPLGATVFIGSQGGLSYLTKNGLLKERSSITEIIRLACKFYRGNIIPCTISIETGLPQGRNLNVEEKLKKFLSDLGAKDVKVAINYKEED